MGPHSLDRCWEKDDWLYKEIREALTHNKNIICVFTDDMVFPDSLPAEIDDIRNQNGLKFELLYFDSFIDKLISQFFVSENSRSVSDEEKDFIIIDDVLVKYIGDAFIVKVPDNVKSIGTNAFKDQTKITEIVLPDSVCELCEGAFERCSGLMYFSLPRTLKMLGIRAFSRCYNLAYIEINDALEEIGDDCFTYCGKLKSLMLNEDLRVISPSAFNNCSQLMELHVAENNPYFTSIEGILYNKTGDKAVRCPENYNSAAVTVPDTVKEIGEWCFSGCTKLIDLVLPEGLETVSAHAFQDSCNIAVLTLGGSTGSALKSFDVSALNGWTARQQVVMGDGVPPVLKYGIGQKLSELRNSEQAPSEYKYCLIKTAFESEEEAVNMTKMLLDNRLIVSGQIKRMRSLYIWEDELNREDEIELTCFTESARYLEVERFINSHHSYELCELICIPVINISPGFGDWISNYIGKINIDL